MAAYDFYAQGALDIARPPNVVLLERINAINGTQYNPDQFALSPIVAEVGTNYNTYVWLMPVASSQWSSGFKVYYSRVQLQDVMVHAAEVATSGSANLYAIMEAINAAYGVYLTEADVFDAVIKYENPLDTAGAGSVVITARATSVFFTGTLTIQINNTVSHGVSTYDDELVHFLAISQAGKDTIVAYNDLGEQVTNYSFMHGVTINSSRIDRIWKRTDGTLLVTGLFNYTETNEFDEQVTSTRKVLSVDRVGKVISASAGNLYGVDYAGLEYAADLDNDRVYVLDTLSQIGGNTHGLHLYLESGAYSNAWTPVLAGRAVAVAPYQDMLYVVTQVDDDAPVLQRLLADGTADPLFTPLPLTYEGIRVGIDVVRITALQASVSGVAAAVQVDTLGGEVPWAEYASDQLPAGVAPPVRFVDHSGALVNAVGIASPLLTTRRVGVATNDSLVAVGTQAVFYSADLVNVTSGRYGQGMAAVKVDGSIPAPTTQAVSDLYPSFLNVRAIYPLAHGDVVVAANVQVVDTGGMQEAAGVFIYSYDGQFATQEVVIPGAQMIACVSHFFLLQV